MKPENPLFPKSDQLDALASRAIHEAATRDKERTVVGRLEELFAADEATVFALPNLGAECSFSSLGNLNVANYTAAGFKQSKIFESPNMPEHPIRYQPNSIKVSSAYETVDLESYDGLSFDSSLFEVDFRFFSSGSSVPDSGASPVKVYGIRVGARAVDQSLEAVNIEPVNPSFNEEEVQAYVIVDQADNPHVFVSTGIPTSGDVNKYREADNVERELVFTELELAIAKLQPGE